jgi:putrescine transport system ATP-binding protein
VDDGADRPVSPSAAPLVRFEGVSKRFGAVAAVDGVSLDIAEGEFFALLGPSGCGKTTLMRLLAGFAAPDAGRVLLNGEDIAGLPPHRRPSSMMFQTYALFPHLKVEKNIGFGLKQQGWDKDRAAARVAEMLALVRLEGLGRRRPDQLSGGQKQRVALARALAPGPKILLLDEPLAALDRKLREETQLELKAIQRRLGVTFMIVTHDRDEAMAVADRIAVMREGQVRQVGAPREVYERPASRFVAEFLGEANLFPNDARGGPGWRLVRPEKLALSAHATPGGLAGQVSEIAYFGDRTRYVIGHGEGRPWLVSRPNAGPPLTLAVGDPAWVSFAAEDAVAIPS